MPIMVEKQGPNLDAYGVLCQEGNNVADLDTVRYGIFLHLPTDPV